MLDWLEEGISDIVEMHEKRIQIIESMIKNNLLDLERAEKK